jgi:hypothetical protein
VLDLKDVVFEQSKYWVLRVSGGFEVYETSVTCSERRANFGYPGPDGMARAVAFI